ncbi:MAG: hypothetical protein V1863_06705 [Candidatus Omnitrophota bacterium]
MESKKQLMLMGSVALLAVLFFVGFRLFQRDEKTVIKSIIYKGVVAVEHTDVARCGLLLSEDYADEYGNAKADVLRFLKSLFEEYPSVRVQIKGLLIKTEDATAEVDLGVATYFKKPNDNQLYGDTAKVKLMMRKQGQNWKIHKAIYVTSNQLLFVQGVA